MGPRDWFETIKEVVKKIGNTGDTGGSQTAGTVFAKENAILESVQNAMQRGMVRNIQRGICTIGENNRDVDVALSGFTNADKMLVFYNSVINVAASNTQSNNAILTKLSTTSCTFHWEDGISAVKRVHYQIVELW